MIIDASGDADVCHHAGFGYELAGEDSPAQTLTTTFRMTNVDVERAKLIQATLSDRQRSQFRTVAAGASALVPPNRRR